MEEADCEGVAVALAAALVSEVAGFEAAGVGAEDWAFAGAAGAGFDPPMFSEMVGGGEGARSTGGLEPPIFREIVGAGAGASV